LPIDVLQQVALVACLGSLGMRISGSDCKRPWQTAKQNRAAQHGLVQSAMVLTQANASSMHFLMRCETA